MSERLAFPMYAVNDEDTQALWRAVRQLLAARGVVDEDTLSYQVPEDLLTHWRHPALLLSQTCGYPLMTRLPAAQTVGCFHYSAPGCEGRNYRSLLVVREAESRQTLADFRGRRVACNSPDSQSGYNVLLKMVAPLSRDGRFFSAVAFSGSHRQSLRELQQGTADIAAIDCVSWALLQRHQPEALAGLVVIAHSPLAPGLPLITSATTSAATLGLLREALQQLVSDERYRPLCEALFICGYSDMRRADYQLLLAWRDEAAARGVVRL
ncbi:PhnD/SsuA/transferrin family substrate-binding protein [Klebsiella grimontii]|uniref:phosphate/phosphite/phosphonate ABC transporter substrate-binding protein n=1 Tax=Klebsiella grimontii TaxID=2058152 RepID=UPI0012BA0BA7|nr:PhnD/SsuA/transferrin family substrate-binding protein [Klebsiella grimontii]MCW9469715.1 PhnD/SsuA/transferrin family substrate-binding protein [Klebsiella grimontii]